MIRISVVIPTFERGEIFTECLDSVLACLDIQDELIVINDSKREEVNVLAKDERLRIFNNPKSGVASARNLGADKSRGKYLLFIDDDMLINKTAIDSCLELLQHVPNSVINADWVYNPDDLKALKKTAFGRYLENIQFTTLKGWCPDLTWKVNDIVKANGLTSQFMLIEKTTFEAVGGYNENFPFAGFEDYDLGKKLEKNNVKFLINTKCCVYHNEKDRMTLTPFLERKKRGAYTRKRGVELGYSELQIPFNTFKQSYLYLAPLFKGLFFFLLKIIPNYKRMDFIYKFCVNRLMGIYIYEGYMKLK